MQLQFIKLKERRKLMHRPALYVQHKAGRCNFIHLLLEIYLFSALLRRTFSFEIAWFGTKSHS